MHIHMNMNDCTHCTVPAHNKTCDCPQPRVSTTGTRAAEADRKTRTAYGAPDHEALYSVTVLIEQPQLRHHILCTTPHSKHRPRGAGKGAGEGREGVRTLRYTMHRAPELIRSPDRQCPRRHVGAQDDHGTLTGRSPQAIVPIPANNYNHTRTSRQEGKMHIPTNCGWARDRVDGTHSRPHRSRGTGCPRWVGRSCLH
jgi:hypothetical protein